MTIEKVVNFPRKCSLAGLVTLQRLFSSIELHDSLQNPPSDRMAIVSKKIAYLGKVYVHSERYFPLGKSLRYGQCMTIRDCS